MLRHREIEIARVNIGKTWRDRDRKSKHWCDRERERLLWREKL